MEEFCSKVAEDRKTNTSSEAVRPSTEHNDECEVSTQSGFPTAVKITLIVTGVLLVCAIVGGLILAKVAKRLRKRQKTPDYCDVYATHGKRNPTYIFRRYHLTTRNTWDDITHPNSLPHQSSDQKTEQAKATYVYTQKGH